MITDNPTIISETTVAGSPTTVLSSDGTVSSLAPHKPWWHSQTIRWLITGILSSAGILAIAVDQLVGLVRDNGAMLPPEWMSKAMIALAVLSIASKFIAGLGRFKVGDLTKGQT